MRTGMAEFVTAIRVLQGWGTSRTDSAPTADFSCQSHRPAVPNFVKLDTSEKKHCTIKWNKVSKQGL